MSAFKFRVLTVGVVAFTAVFHPAAFAKAAYRAWKDVRA